MFFPHIISPLGVVAKWSSAVIAGGLSLQCGLIDSVSGGCVSV